MTDQDPGKTTDQRSGFLGTFVVVLIGTFAVAGAPVQGATCRSISTEEAGRPVQVVENDQQRVPRCEVAQQTGEGVELTEPRLRRIAVIAAPTPKRRARGFHYPGVPRKTTNFGRLTV